VVLMFMGGFSISEECLGAHKTPAVVVQGTIGRRY
jgi:hypothetical protein